MAFDPIVAAVEGGGYISLIKIVPPLILLALWARLLTWVDKDAVAAHLPRIPLNVAFLCGMVVGVRAVLLPARRVLVAFVALLFVFVVEIGDLPRSSATRRSAWPTSRSSSTRG